MAKIVVVGSFNMDLTSYLERLPRPGETVHGSRFQTGPGGKGSNQAVAAARLDAQITFVGRVGVDTFGDAAIAIWQREGIDTRYVIRDSEVATGVAPIFVDEHTAENVVAVILGANNALSAEDVDRAEAEIASAGALLTQLELPLAAVQRALQLAKQRGVTTILNPAPAPAEALPQAVLRLVDYLTPNESELDTLCAQSGAASLSTVEAKARSLLTSDDQTVIVTLGAQGAQYVRRSGTAVIPGFRVKAVDTTGAGDAFNGGFTVGLTEGKSLEDAIRFGHATAALSVTKPGTASSMPQRAEVEAFLRERAGG
jgi:ribokinase